MNSDSKLWARALTVTTLAAAGLLLSGCSLLGQVTNAGGGGTGGDDTTEGTEDDVFSLVIGDCFNDETDAETVSTVDIVECSTPHTWEAFESVQMSEADYPGDSATQDEADSSCYDPFTAYVGVVVDNSIYDYSFYYPTEETWTQINDREILCIVTTTDDFTTKTTGSVAGTAK